MKLGGVSAAELRRNCLRRASRVRGMLLETNIKCLLLKLFDTQSSHFVDQARVASQAPGVIYILYP